MLSLIEVNFSNNLFTGPMPTFVPFQNSPNSSFWGNKGLCGKPLIASCVNSKGADSKNLHHRVSYRIILAVIASGLVVFVSVTVIVLLFMMRERREKSAKVAEITDDKTDNQPMIITGNVFVENLRQAIDFDVVVKATLKESNKLSEYAYTMQVTARGNVYSYGVVLLGILTTQLPVDEAFGEGIDLVKWVHSALARGETPEQILDARLSTLSFTWRKEMLSALKVALLCTDTTPAKRPKMKKVVEMLQDITQN
ncbi:hypothetical protein F0562_017375 [Nyssa sinensis]|uniref:Serine-threonine/tyrosine-protein kinase catalytic domain-containing protein n=1 Tax=Nyssa sinensis TaxID=561372 RepID=A0A5J4ZHU8_9ASTE|nr:hypothetical protein F0562_017375 [Nyssa sinensis]